jgi:hypothetical protein
MSEVAFQWDKTCKRRWLMRRVSLKNVGPAGVLKVVLHAHRVEAANPLLLLLARDTRRDKPPTTARLDAIVVLIAQKALVAAALTTILQTRAQQQNTHNSRTG